MSDAKKPVGGRDFDLFERLMPILGKPVYWSDGAYTFTSDATATGDVLVRVHPGTQGSGIAITRSRDPRMAQVNQIIETWRVDGFESPPA